MSRAIVIIEADPRRSARATEGLRCAVGLALAENAVEVFLSGSARALLDTGPTVFPGSRSAALSIEALGDLGVVVHAGAPRLTDYAQTEAVIRWGA
jgi:hypothetical protein